MSVSTSLAVQHHAVKGVGRELKHFDVLELVLQTRIAGQIGARTDLARSQTGAAAANERLRHWREAVNAYRSAGQTWSALRGLQALAPEDAGQPEKAEAAMARCQRRI